MDGKDLAELYNRTREATDAPHELAEEIEELTKQLEGLPCLVRWHERARVKARVALQQAELGERLIDKGQRERAGGIDVRTPRPCVT
jgi:hypothetical protein